MVDFREDLILETYRIPCLIWIQLLITFLLLLILFFGFAAFTSEPTSGSHAPATNNSASPDGIITVEDERAGGGTESSGEEEDESSVKDTILLSIFRHPNHPCNYFGLVKQALFKCFGFDSSSESSVSRQHEKQD
ncbi:hypothetical protein AAHA92_01047 [Salvia divinorum]|uniref:Uncharacterized protein n=1 Tax=Salvia divinorum TaxID=28513 RepID=A0ABD1ILK6_SALDI